MFKVVATDSFVEECVKAKKMLATFSNFASIKNAKKYKEEITKYISSIRLFRGFRVKVHLLSPYDSCNRDVQVYPKIIKDTDISEARMGLNPTLMECLMFLPKPMKSNWKVLKQTVSSKESEIKMLRRVPSNLKLFGCFGRVGDLCILKNIQSGGICNLECKWHGQYDLAHMESNANLFNACSRVPKELPVFKKTRWGKYSRICNRNYPALNKKVTYRCVKNDKKGYYVYRQQTELELGRLS